MVRGCRTAMKETDDENLVIHRLFNFYYNSSDASVKDYTSSHETTIRKRGNT